MRGLFLTLSRFAITAWVGAAALFVTTSISEQSSEHFDSVIRDQLALLRFPDYYAAGFALVGAALATALPARKHPSVGDGRMLAYMGVLVSVLVLMIVDYVWIYRTLVGMITPPGAARSAEFVTYHEASMRINAADLALALIASLLICWPGRSATPPAKGKSNKTNE